MMNLPPKHIKTVSEYHKTMGLPNPAHPLISVISFDEHREDYRPHSSSFVFDFYCIAVKRNFRGKIKYGQQDYDFDEGIMTFMAPGQVLKIELKQEDLHHHSGWLLLFHPDFLWKTPLAQHIRHYEYFDYSVHEALFLSDKEESTIVDTLKNIQQEYHSSIDNLTQNIIIAQLELLLNYAQRFYQRQFITRKITNTKLLERLDELLNAYLQSDDLIERGLPTVKTLSDDLHVSPNYLSALLKNLTGKTTQVHIQDKIIDRAKHQLSTTELSVSEIAYNLGFSHPQSFSKLFKLKTSTTPQVFRSSFRQDDGN